MSVLFARYVVDAENAAYHRKWVRDNPGEAARWAAYRDKVLAPVDAVSPIMVTHYGRALVHAGEMELELLKGSGTLPRGGTAPVNTVLPSISGSAAVGSALTANVGTWTGSPTAYSYQWERAALPGTYSPIAAATGTTYAPVAGDVGFTIRVVVAAQNAGGQTFATSAATSAVVSGGGGFSFGTSLSLNYPRIPESSGTNYYVSTAGSDSNSGTLGSPWLTIQKAFDTVPLVGSIINVRTGSYTDADNQLEWTRTGNSINPVTLQSYPGELAVIDATRLRITGDYFRVRNMKIQNPPFGVQDCIRIEGQAHHIDIDGMELTGFMWQGILAGSAGDICTDIQVWNSKIHGWQSGGGAGPGHDHGIYLANTRRFVIANTLIYNNQNGWGIQVYPDVDDLVITGCTIDDHLFNPGGSVVIWEGTNISNVRMYASLLTNQNSGSAAVTVAGALSGCAVYDTLAYQGASTLFPSNPGITYTNTTVANPLYTNQPARDYELGGASPAIGLPQSGRDGYLPSTYRDGSVRAARVAGSEPPA